MSVKLPRSEEIIAQISCYMYLIFPDYFASVPVNFEYDSLVDLDKIRSDLLSDIAFAYESDPAAGSPDEIILCYPGFFAIAVHRLAHVLYENKIALVPRMMSEYAHSKTGIDIHPGAKIATPFFIDHGTGVVIGETAEIGRYVKIYQGVTIGAKSIDGRDKSKKKRHPTIGDNCIIYAGATILGGQTIIGNNCVVGGNVWLTHSLSPGTTVIYKE